MIFMQTFIGPIFYKLLYMSLTALAAGAAVLLIRRLADKRFSPFWKYAMWILVLAALVIPWRPQSRVAVLGRAEAVQDVSFREDLRQAEAAYSVMLSEAQAPAQEVEAARSEAAALRAKTLAFDELLPLLWLCGAAGAAAFMGIGAIRLRRGIRRSEIIGDMTRYEDLLERCKRRLGIKRRVRIVLQSHVGTPALLGLLRPVILLPSYAANMSDARLEYVILHELSHLRRGDGLVNALLLGLRAVYWFNPLVWLLFKFVREDMELANDAAVLRGMEQENRKEYSLSLVEVLASCGKQRPVMLCMADSKKNIERRIDMIQLGEFFKKRKWVIAVAGVLVIAGTSALFLTQGMKRSESWELPEAYRPLLEGIHRLVLTAREEDGDWDWIREPEMRYLESQYLGDTDYKTEGNMGYALVDINDDGTPELLWLGKNSENPEEFLLYALFTLQDGNPVRLYDRGHRFPGVLAQDGTLYCATGTAMEAILLSYKLEPGAAELTQLTEYSKNVEGIDADEAFKKLRDEYTNPPRPMQFTFIPIEQIAIEALVSEDTYPPLTLEQSISQAILQSNTFANAELHYTLLTEEEGGLTKAIVVQEAAGMHWKNERFAVGSVSGDAAMYTFRQDAKGAYSLKDVQIVDHKVNPALYADLEEQTKTRLRSFTHPEKPRNILFGFGEEEYWVKGTPVGKYLPKGVFSQEYMPDFKEGFGSDGSIVYYWSKSTGEGDTLQTIRKIELELCDEGVARYHFKDYGIDDGYKYETVNLTLKQAGKLAADFARDFWQDGDKLTCKHAGEGASSLYDPGNIENWQAVRGGKTYNVMVDLRNGAVVYAAIDTATTPGTSTTETSSPTQNQHGTSAPPASITEPPTRKVPALILHREITQDGLLLQVDSARQYNFTGEPFTLTASITNTTGKDITYGAGSGTRNMHQEIQVNLPGFTDMDLVGKIWTDDYRLDTLRAGETFTQTIRFSPDTLPAGEYKGTAAFTWFTGTGENPGERKQLQVEFPIVLV